MEVWSKFNRFAYTMLQLAYVNLLWLLFTALGLVVFGVFPATAAMFTIIHKMIQQEEEIKIFKTFWHYFKKDFLILNSFALTFYAVAYFLYFDFSFLKLNSGKLVFLYPPLIFILISSAVTLFFFFPVFVHFKLTFFQYFKQAFLIAITSPAELFLMILSVISIYIAVTVLPGIIPLFTGSIFAYLSVLISFRAFDRIERKQEMR